MKNETKHTPGPWKVRVSGNSNFVDVIGVCNLGTSQGKYGYRINDARLIAAAPELLSALENLAAQFDARGKYANTHGNVLSALLDARKVIAKAKGSQS